MSSLLDPFLGPHVGPRWERNQRAEYARALATACETRARSLGLDVLANVDLGPESGSIFEKAAQAAVRQLPAALERDMFFRDSRGRDQCERLARDCPALRGDGGGLFPAFSDNPTVGQYLAWRQFEFRFNAYYSPRVCAIMDRQIQEALARRVAERQEKQRLKKGELKTSLARGVAAWSLADLKADCKLLDLPVSGNKGQLFSRLQGYVDGTVRPKKKRRR